MLRSPAVLPSSRQCSNRAPLQRTCLPAGALRVRAPRAVRAEADNTGGSITNAGKTEKPDSYQVRQGTRKLDTNMYCCATLLHAYACALCETIADATCTSRCLNLPVYI